MLQIIQGVGIFKWQKFVLDVQFYQKIFSEVTIFTELEEIYQWAFIKKVWK